MSCGVGRRHGSDPLLLWLWCRLVATAPIGPLAWEPPYATGAALEKAKRQKKKKKKKNIDVGTSVSPQRQGSFREKELFDYRLERCIRHLASKINRSTILQSGRQTVS